MPDEQDSKLPPVPAASGSTPPKPTTPPGDASSQPAAEPVSEQPPKPESAPKPEPAAAPKPEAKPEAAPKPATPPTVGKPLSAAPPKPEPGAPVPPPKPAPSQPVKPDAPKPTAASTEPPKPATPPTVSKPLSAAPPPTPKPTTPPTVSKPLSAAQPPAPKPEVPASAPAQPVKPESAPKPTAASTEPPKPATPPTVSKPLSAAPPPKPESAAAPPSPAKPAPANAAPAQPVKPEAPVKPAVAAPPPTVPKPSAAVPPTPPVAPAPKETDNLALPAAEADKVPSTGSLASQAKQDAPMPANPTGEPASPSATSVPNIKTGQMPKPATSTNTQKCAVCGHINRVGVLVCENCGTNLVTGRETSVGTKDFGKEPGDDTESHEVMVNTAGSSRFEDNMMLRLEIDGAPTPIVIYPKTETSLGRRDPGTGSSPDIDLTAYAGYRQGVSRNHAMLRLRDKVLEIYDLGSSNGTLVNGVRLNAHQPHPLRDGDEVTLGKMVIRVLFQARNTRPRS
ncbi:MAG: FHA domain-containing protein [Anaerolineae bacterium]|nr:FHA domain-containing protein [Anaerolineae bacterium]